MAFIGTLDAMPVPDILQTLSMLRRSGRLTVQQDRTQAFVVLRDGRIVSAYFASGHENLGDCLIRRGLVSESNIAMALRIQQSMQPPPLLGSVLVEMNLLDPAVLQQVLTEVVERVLGELVTWTRGDFRFNPETPGIADKTTAETRDLVLPGGIRADQAILSAVGLRDEEQRGRPAEPEAEDETAPSALDMEEQAYLPAADGCEVLSEKHVLEALLQSKRGQEYGARYGEMGRDPLLLRSIVEPFRTASNVPETSLVIMQHASSVVRRGVLFAVTERQLQGIGQFGVQLDGLPASERVRNTHIPLDAPCVVGAVARYQRVFRGQLAPTPWNDFLVRQLGGGQPAEAIAVPLVVRNRALLVFYGDNLPSQKTIGPTMALELLMLYGGFALERCLLGAKGSR